MVVGDNRSTTEIPVASGRRLGDCEQRIAKEMTLDLCFSSSAQANHRTQIVDHVASEHLRWGLVLQASQAPAAARVAVGSKLSWWAHWGSQPNHVSEAHSLITLSARAVPPSRFCCTVGFPVRRRL